MTDFHFVVIGTGAAGVSAAFPLVEAGLKVLLVDADDGADAPAPPQGPFLRERHSSPDQWQWGIGKPGVVPRWDGALSPKFRVPTLAPLFRGYKGAIRVETEDFELIGSLASGGLTRAWGAGVAEFDGSELAQFPRDARDLRAEYAAIAERIGISGGTNDDLSDAFGRCARVSAPHQLGPAGMRIERHYLKRRDALGNTGFRMGRARLAVLTGESGGHADRAPCDRLGNCLWGCAREAIYSAGHDLAVLKRKSGVAHLTGVVAEHLRREDDGWSVDVVDRVGERRSSVRASRVVLAAGTIASTRLALDLLGAFDTPVRLLSSPTAGFALLDPRLIASPQVQQAALAHHAFLLEGTSGLQASGFLFPSFGIPMAEFATRTPLGLRASVALLRVLLPAMTVGNVFFDGGLSRHAIRLTAEGMLRIRGGFAPEFEDTRRTVASKLRGAFRSLNLFAMPGSFAPGAPGSDVHYAGTFPMRDQPTPLATNSLGELSGHDGVHLVDGAVLPILPAKSHTFTVMANAMRIGKRIAAHKEFLHVGSAQKQVT